MRRVSLKRSTGLKRSRSTLKSSKQNAWKQLRKELFEELASLGISSCELMLPECTGRLMLTLAHSKKRRKIKTDAELREVIVACSSCHYKIEYLPENEMYSIVLKVIENRGFNLC